MSTKAKRQAPKPKAPKPKKVKRDQDANTAAKSMLDRIAERTERR